MRYYLLGKSGLRVSEICLGAMTFGEEWGWGASKEESRLIFDAYVDAGGNFIDTANKYTEGTSEKYVGEFIRSDRNRFVLATKYTSNIRRGDPNAGGNHRKSLIQSLDASLDRLNTDYIDLYWVHAWDPMTPIEELMRALDDMVRAGKILYIGISDAPAWIVSHANTLAEMKGWTPFTGLQIEYSLIERTPERELLPMASALDIGVTAWSPLGGGILTGKYSNTKKEQRNHQIQDKQEDHNAKEEEGRMIVISSKSGDPLNVMFKDRDMIIAEEVSKIAKEIVRVPSQVALNWIRQQQDGKGRNRRIIPIIGSKKESQIRENLASLEFELTKDQLQRLNEASKIDLGFPHDFLASDRIKDIIYGSTFSSIYNHRS
jgi:aryl-alcohol dehydrogenase-like predicted oxidoreductase